MFALATASNAQAEFNPSDLCEKNSLVLGGWSVHKGLSEDEYDYNESHDVVGLTCDNFSIMKFENSYYEDAWGLGYETDSFYEKNIGPVTFDASAYVGLWTGYESQGFDVAMPVGGLRGSASIDRFRVSLTTAYYVTTLNLEFRLR